MTVPAQFWTLEALCYFRPMTRQYQFRYSGPPRVADHLAEVGMLSSPSMSYIRQHDR